jgi:hypothetical protein
VPERSGGLEGGRHNAERSLEPFFEAAAQHLRRGADGIGVAERPTAAFADR